MSHPTLILPDDFTIQSLRPALWLSAALGVGTTGARSLSQARGEQFLGGLVSGHGMNDIAMSAWVYPVSSPAAQSPFIFYTGGNGATYPGVCLRQSQTNRYPMLYFATGVDGTNEYVQKTTSMPLNAWTHLFGYVDRVNKILYLYVNGVLANSASYTGNTSSFTNSSYLAIGGMTGLPSEYRYDGRISRCGYFIGTLDHAAAAAHLYNQGNGRFWAEVTRPDLVAAGKHYYNLNESPLSPAIDAIGTNDCAIAGTNLITNPGLESGVLSPFTASVSGSSTVQVIASNQRSGSYCAEMHVVSEAYAGLLLSSLLISGRSYTASCYIKSAGGTPFFKMENATQIYSASTGSTYVGHNVTFVASSASFAIARLTGGADYTFYIDDVSLTSAQIDSAAGPREAMASDLVGGYHGVLTNMDAVSSWSTDTPDGSYTAAKLDSVGTAHGTMTGFTDIDAAHVDGPDGAWGPAITDRGSSPAQGWLLSSVKDSRSASVPSSLNTRIFDEQYSEPASTGSRWFTGTQRLDGTDAFDSVGATVTSLAAWVYHTNTAATRAIASTTASVTTSPGIKLWLTNAHQLYVTIRTSTPVSDSHGWTVAIPAYQWVHVGCTVNATTGLICLYVNGTLVASKTSSLGGTLFESGASWVGNYGTAESIEGAIACITASDSIEWSVSDFQTLFNGGKARKYADLPAAMQARIGTAFDLDGSTTETEEIAGTKTLTVTNGPISTAASPYLPAFDATLTGFTSSPRSSDVPTALVGKCKSIQGGTNKYATTGVKTLSGMGARSVAVWIKRNGAPSVREDVIGEGTASVGAVGFSLHCDTSGWVTSRLANGSAFVFGNAGAFNSGMVLTDNAWHHIVITWDGTTDAGAVKMYIDNVIRDTDTAIATSQGAASTANFQISGYNNTSGDEFTGLICRPQVFAGRALTATEVATLYAGGDVTEGLTAEWRFNEPDSITVPFEHALAGNGTMTNVHFDADALGVTAKTISGFVRVDGLGGGSGGRLLDNGRFYFIPGTTQFTASVGAINVFSSPYPAITGVWCHVAMAVDSAGHVETFLDGKRVPLQSIATVNAGSPAAATTDFTISNRAAGDRAFQGLIGQVRIDSGVLTQAQIRQLALGQSPSTPTHDWRFDDPLDLPYLDGCRAIRFDGVDDRIVATNGISAYPFTIMGWVRTSINGAFQGVVSIHSGGSTYWYIGCSSAGYPYISARNTTEYAINGTTVIADGQWHHIAGVFASATDRRLYVDGNLVASDTNSVTFAASADAFIGMVRTSAPQYYVNGDEADARIYSTALAQSQIRQIIDGTDYTTGLTARWKFGETPRSIPSCAGGYSLEFDGSDDVVDCGATFPAMTSATLAAWVKSDAFSGGDCVLAFSGWKYALRIAGPGGQLLGFVNTDATDGQTNSIEAVRIGEWTHVAMTYNDSGDRIPHLYLNGVECTYSVNTAATGTIVANSTFKIGLVDTSYFDGNIDDARLYSSVLSPADIALLAAGGEPATAPVAHWPFDDGPQYGEPSNGDPIAVWEARNGINFAQATTSARPTFLQSGANGRPGITFDGVGQYLRQANWMPSETSGTFVMAVKLGSVANANAIFSSCDEGGLGSYFYVGTTATTGYHSIEQRNAGDTSDAIASAGAFGTSAVRIASFRSDGSLSSARLDGTNYPLSTILAGVNNGDWLGDTTLRDSTVIGALARSTLSFFLNGTIYEILYFPKPLSDVELRKVERQLGSKYGVTVA